MTQLGNILRADNSYELLAAMKRDRVLKDLSPELDATWYYVGRTFHRACLYSNNNDLKFLALVLLIDKAAIVSICNDNNVRKNLKRLAIKSSILMKYIKDRKHLSAEQAIEIHRLLGLHRNPEDLIILGQIMLMVNDDVCHTIMDQVIFSWQHTKEIKFTTDKDTLIKDKLNIIKTKVRDLFWRSL